MYFWNIPKCTFSHIGELFSDPAFNYHILKGLVLSISSPIEGINTYAYESLKTELEKGSEIKLLVSKNLIKLLRVFRNKEKFLIACMRTLQLIIKNELCLFEKHDEELNAFVDELKLHCAKSVSASKVN